MGYEFVSDTDSEVIAHLTQHYAKTTKSLRKAVQKTIARLEGAYALGVISDAEPECLIGARSGSPLVIGVGIEEHFIASDQMALRQVTDRFVFLEEGDLAEIHHSGYKIYDDNGKLVNDPCSS